MPVHRLFPTLGCLTLLGALTAVTTAQAAAPALNLPRPSQKSELTQTIGLTKIGVVYSRPGVKGRTIWGDLVPWDKVWRTGANEATQFTISADVKVMGQALKAGNYSLHTIPGKDHWTVIFNKVADQWGSYAYNDSADALRVTVTPVAHEMQEWLQFSFPDIAVDRAVLALDWEKVRVPIEITVDTIPQALAGVRVAMASLDSKDDGTARRAAQFAFDNDQAPDEAMQWIDKSIAIKPGWLNLRLKANMLAKRGKTAEAISFAQRAIESGKKKDDEAPPDELAKIEKQIAEWKQKS